VSPHGCLRSTWPLAPLCWSARSHSPLTAPACQALSRRVSLRGRTAPALRLPASPNPVPSHRRCWTAACACATTPWCRSGSGGRIHGRLAARPRRRRAAACRGATRARPSRRARAPKPDGRQSYAASLRGRAPLSAVHGWIQRAMARSNKSTWRFAMGARAVGACAEGLGSAGAGMREPTGHRCTL